MEQEKEILVSSEVAIILVSVIRIYFNEKLGHPPSKEHMQAVLQIPTTQVLSVLFNHPVVNVALPVSLRPRFDPVISQDLSKFIESVFYLAQSRFPTGEDQTHSEKVLLDVNKLFPNSKLSLSS